MWRVCGLCVACVCLTSLTVQSPCGKAVSSGGDGIMCCGRVEAWWSWSVVSAGRWRVCVSSVLGYLCRVGEMGAESERRVCGGASGGGDRVFLVR